MKKLAILLSVLAVLTITPRAHAQASAANYTFATTTTGSLTDMSSGTTVLLPANLDDLASPVTAIPFDFFFMGVRQTQFTVNANGSLRFGSTPIGNTAYDPLGQGGQFVITAYGADQRTHAGDGKVHYKVTGTAPNRVLVVEWLNMQAAFNINSTADLTYEVRLHETSGAIEFVYGSMTMSTAGSSDLNSNTPQIGFSSNNTANTVGTITAPQGGAPAPSYASASVPVNNPYIAGPITVLTSAADGSRRTFTMTPIAVTAPGGPLTFTGVNAATTTVHWTDSPNELGYAIYTSTDGVNFTFAGSAAQNATSFSVSNLNANTNYTWRVHATNEGATAFTQATQTTSSPGSITTTGAGGLWSNPATWSGGVIPTINDIVTIDAGATVTIDTAATAYVVNVAGLGVLQFEQTTARTLAVNLYVAVSIAGVFQSNPAGTQTGHMLTVGGGVFNNGTLDFSTNGDTAGAGITFTGAANVTFSGIGVTTDIRVINVSKGPDPASMVELMTTNFTVRGVTTDTVAGGWLVMTSGTLKISGTFAGTSRVFSTSSWTIPAGFRFWLNNPNYVVAAQASGAVNNGVLRITQGVFNQGTSLPHQLGGGGGAQFIIEGGTVNIAGRFSSANAILYSQSAGAVNVSTVGNLTGGVTESSFTIPSLATFDFSGGTIVLVQACGGSTPGDYFNAGTNLSLAGTLQVGSAATASAFVFRLRGALPNLVVDNSGTGKTATAAAQIGINGTTLIKSGSSLVIDGQTCVVTGTTFTNDGTLTGTAPNSQLSFAGGQGPQTFRGSGTVTAPLTLWVVDNPANVTIDPATPQVVVNRFENYSGGLINANRMTLGNGGATSAAVVLGKAGVTQPVAGFDVAPLFNPGTGGVNLTYAPEIDGRTTGPEVPPGRTLTTLTISNPNPITIAGGDLTVNGTTPGALALNGGRVITGANRLFFNSTLGTIARTTGSVDGTLMRAVAANGAVLFDLGTANGYTPVTFNVTGGSLPTTIAAAAVQTPAPGIQPLAKAINRYWTFGASGITADITVSYLDPVDIPGTVTESGLHFFRHGTANPHDYTDEGGSTNTAANTATITGVSSFSDWTLAMPGADLSIQNTDGVTTATPGGSVTYTITASNNGPALNPSATVTDSFMSGLTCSWMCSGTGGGTCTGGGMGNISDTVSLPSGGAVTYVANCTISSSLTGSISNTAMLTANGVTDDDSANNSATDSDSLFASADLAITKTDGVTTATPGGSVTYTVIAMNNGPSALTGATVTDSFPTSLTCSWMCTPSGGGSCTMNGSGNISDTVNLPVGAAASYTAICTISPSASGFLTNSAHVAPPAGTADPAGANNDAVDQDTLTASADLGITKTDGVTTATPGNSVTYTITASNPGPSNVAGAVVTDTFPAALTCGWTCIPTGGGTCSNGSGNLNDTVNLPANSSVTYTAICTIASSATGTLSNAAHVAAPAGVTDSNMANDTATDNDSLTPQADLSITKDDGRTSVTAGGSTIYTITASNPGPSDAPGTLVTDTFPAGLTCTWTCGGAGGGVCTASGSGNLGDTANLPAGSSVTYLATCTVDALATGTISNTASLKAPASVTDPVPGNNSAQDDDSITPSADLGVTKTDGVTSATAGGTTTYTITATNAGPSNVTGATVTDTFPGSLTCTWSCSGTSGGSCSMNGMGNIADTVNLPSGASVTYLANCTISAFATGSLTNTASIAPPAGTTDPNSANDMATDIDALGASADLSISKTDGVTSLTPGGTTTYTIVATNLGPSNATGATVTDTFPAGLTCTWSCSGAGGGSCTANGMGNINDTVNLPAAGSVTYLANCTVSALASGTIQNTAHVSAPPTVTDTNPGNDTATDSDAVMPPAAANVSGTKTASGSFAVGGTVTYTIVLTNSGTGAQGDNPGNELTDVLPPSLTVVSATASSGTAVTNVGTNTVTWNGAIPAGGSVTITITATVRPAAGGTTVSNQGVISYDSDGNGTNDATRPTDDPSVAGASDPTTFAVPAVIAAIPALSPFGLLMMMAALAAVAFFATRRAG